MKDVQACGCAAIECLTFGCKLQRALTPGVPNLSGGILIPHIPAGCICPPTSEQTCQSPICPRKPIPSVGGPRP